MNLFRFFSKGQSAPAARERLQVLLAHERAATGDIDLVNKLRDEILKAISKHMQVDDEKVSIKMERGPQVSTLAVDLHVLGDRTQDFVAQLAEQIGIAARRGALMGEQDLQPFPGGGGRAGAGEETKQVHAAFLPKILPKKPRLSPGMVIGRFSPFRRRVASK